MTDKHGEWLPIETALKDGTEVLAYLKNDGDPMISIVGWDVADGVWCRGPASDFLPVEEPTHWMPLPPPPTST